jgi:hypothetical protein
VLSKSITKLPVLSVAQTGHTVVLTWPTNSVGLALQSAALNAGYLWSDVSQTPQVSGTNLTVTLPTASNGAKYRLFQP